MRRHARFSAILIASIVLGGAAACSTAGSSSTPASLVTTRIQVDPGSTADTPIWIAYERGYFQQHGVNPVIVQSTNTMGPISSGQVDVAFPSPAPAMSAVVQGASLKVFMSLEFPTEQQVMVNPQIYARYNLASVAGKYPAAIQALKGMTIGVTTPGASLDNNIRYMLRQAGMNPDTDVKIIDLSSIGALLESMEAGRIDVAMSIPPNTQQLLASGKGKVLLNIQAGQGPAALQQPYDVGVATDSFIASHSDAVKGVEAAVEEAYQYISDPKNASDVVKITQQKIYSGIIPTNVAMTTLTDLIPTLTHLSFSQTDFNNVLAVTNQAEAAAGKPAVNLKYSDFAAADLLPKQGS